MVYDVLDLGGAAQPGLFSLGEHFIEQMKILLLLGGGVDQARVRRGVTRFEFLDRLKVARVGDDNGKLFELFELADFSAGFCVFGSGGTHKMVCFGGKILRMLPS